MIASSVHRWAILVAAASAFVLAWHAAINGALVVPVPPDPMPGATPEETMTASFAWLRGIAPHDLGVRAFGAFAFLALVGLGAALSARHVAVGPEAETGRPRMARAAHLLVVAGIFGALGQLVELGGHQAAISASSSLAPATTVGLVEFFVDQVAAAITTAAWAIFGVAALTGALATGGRLAVPGSVLGAALIVMAASRVLDDPADIADALLLITGIALVPIWALGFLAPVGAERRLPIESATA